MFNRVIATFIVSTLAVSVSGCDKISYVSHKVGLRGCGGESPSPGPAGVSEGLVLWIDASEASSVISEGDRLKQLSDKSGNENHFKAVAGKEPLLTPNVFGKKAAATFDGRSSAMVVEDLVLKTFSTIFVVLKAVEQTGIILEHHSANADPAYGGNGFILYSRSTPRWLFARSDLAHTDRGWGNWLGLESTILTLNYGPDEQELYKNREPLKKGELSGSLLRNSEFTETLNLGSRGAGSTLVFNGHIGAVVIYQCQLSEKERLAVYDHLKQRFGIREPI